MAKNLLIDNQQLKERIILGCGTNTVKTNERLCSDRF